MAQGDLTIATAVRSLRLSPQRGYLAALVVYAVATGLAWLALPAIREALFACYFPAIVLATLMGGGYAGLIVAFGYWLWPLASAEDALVLMLYVDAAVLLLWMLDLLNQAFDALLTERDGARLLLQENQHRTANSLMFIAGFLRAQRRNVEAHPARGVECLDQAVRRLDTVSGLHRRLAHPSGGAEALPQLFQQVCDGLITAAGARNVSVSIEIDPVELEMEQVMLLALLLAEIVTNALKHAFENGRSGVILVRLASSGRDHVFEVRDDGRGLRPNLPAVAGQGAGQRIIETIAAQLGGRLTRRNEGGLCTRLTFPRRR